MVDACTEAASDGQCDVETSVERLFQGYRLTRTAPAVEVAARGARGLRDRARLHRHRRRQRRQRADRGRAADGQPRQRHRAQPPARRGGDGRGARDDARRDAGDGGRGREAASHELRADRLARRWEGTDRDGAGRPLPLRGRRGGRARDRGAPGRGGDGGPRRRAALPGAPAARGGGRGGAARAAGRQARRGGGGARSTPPSASWPRRSARARARGGTSELLHLAGLRRRGVPPVPGHRAATTSPPRPTRTSASRSSRCRWRSSTRRSRTAATPRRSWGCSGSRPCSD